MFRRERRGSAGVIEKRKSFAAGRWAMLGLLGAGAVTIAVHQTRRRPPRRTRLDAVLEEAHLTTDNSVTETPVTGPHYVEAASGAIQTQPEPSAEKTPAAPEPAARKTPATPEAGSKMADAAPFRERDFAGDTRQQTPPQEKDETRIVDQHQMKPDAIAAGGDIGELEGDKQSFGEVPTIIDQNEATPVFSQQN